MNKNLKISLVSLAFGLGLLCIPSITMAAYNDATLTTDTIINVAGIDLNVSGMSAAIESITVSTSSFSFTLQPGSSLQVTSPDKKVLATDASAQYIGNRICTTEQSVLAHYSDVGSPTITITPSATICSAVPSVSGGGYSSPVTSVATTTQPLNTPSATTTVTTTSSPTRVSPYVRVLSVGSEGDDVVALQSFLEARGFLTMPEGIIKGYFGQATKKAIEKYQSSTGLAPVGIFGPATRTKIEAESGLKVEMLVTSATYNRSLSIGSKGNDVRALQEFLISHNAGSQAEALRKNGASHYFGKLTKAALAEYQASVGISPAEGYFGTVTRAYITRMSD